MNMIGHAYLNYEKVDLAPFKAFYTGLAKINKQRIEENIRLEDFTKSSERNVLIDLMQKNELKRTKPSYP